MKSEKTECLYCHITDAETPLVNLRYLGKPLWICPQHLPLLIHNPAELIGKLPGAENLKPADHHA
jgi:hypothetical protein